MSDPLNHARGAIFDLDGVLVDTARFHFVAWRRLAQAQGFGLTEADNEKLKGVSRVRSLEILMHAWGIEADPATKQEWMDQKNRWYREAIGRLGPDDMLPGARAYLERCRAEGRRVALGSASKNAPEILERLEATELFDAIVDGNRVTQAKPDPAVFVCAAHDLKLSPADCVVFEDAVAGVEAAHRAGMRVIGIGDTRQLGQADLVVPGLYALLN